jgi:hypothetical protein
MTALTPHVLVFDDGMAERSMHGTFMANTSKKEILRLIGVYALGRLVSSDIDGEPMKYPAGVVALHRRPPLRESNSPNDLMHPSLGLSCCRHCSGYHGNEVMPLLEVGGCRGWTRRWMDVADQRWAKQTISSKDLLLLLLFGDI